MSGQWYHLYTCMIPLAFGLSLMSKLIVSSSACGGFIDIIGEKSGYIASSNHPSPYPNRSLCIWLLQSEEKRRIRLKIPRVHGDNLGGTCVDYLEIRDGNSAAKLRLSTCNMTSSLTLKSEARWFWVKFVSDGEQSNTGFKADWETYYTGETFDGLDTPVKDCRSFLFTCANRECVSTSYVCDKINDCGCDQGCDESDCTGLPLNRVEMIGIGISMGVIGFIIVLIIVIAVDRHQHNSVWQKISALGRGDTTRKKLVR